MKFTRQFTQPDQDVFKQVEWTTRSSKIANLDGSVVFEMNDAEVPASWSQLATDIMVSKYFRKAGVPQTDAAGKPIKDANGKVVTGPEKSARDVIHRLAGCWRHWGQAYGYFDTDEDAQAFYDELCHMMLHQMAAPNSPQWFNTGLNFAYGINGPAQGHWIADDETGEPSLSEDAYTHPQPHACFIQSVGDDLVNEGGIMDLWVREARLFKYGSGTGTNFSHVRGENEALSGGGKSSGLMSFLKIGDRAAGAIKSGGTTRRAAKMVCLDLDHPDIEAFVSWKVREELKVQALVEGMKALPGDRAELAQRLGLELGYDFNNESYATVSGQNSNNSVRIPDKFFHAVDHDEPWQLVRRTDGELAKTVRARDLWDLIGLSAWSCADPGVQYDSTINAWHTCPESGRINASNPCSEYMFLDNTACNLASLNLLKFYDAKSRTFDLEKYEHATRVWTVVLEISVLMAQFPSKEIAELSWKYRTLGLGYANLGAMLMQAGIPYDSQRGRAICGCLSAILTGRSYATSAELAEQLGAFAGYEANQEHMLRVVRNHRRAAYGVSRDLHEGDKHALGSYEQLEIKPVPIDAAALTTDDEPYGKLAGGDALAVAARQAWDDALALGKKHGYRNAQTTVIAPTGTIGLLMDCDTTGVEPDFALVKFKKLAGGGYFKIANQSLRPSLVALGYDDAQVRDILTHVMGTLTLDVPMPGDPTRSFTEWLTDKGFTPAALERVKDALPTVFEMHHAFNAWTLGQETLEAVGLGDRADDPSLDVLRSLGLSKAEVRALNAIVCGSQTVEGAPHLEDAHLAVFDCANTCGPTGQRFIAPEGHIHMMAAAQPFISGAISKTINLPNSASQGDIQSAYRLSWELGLKANALYRDGCKLSQVLNNKVEEQGEQDDEAIEAAKEELAEEVGRAVEAARSVEADEVKEKIVEKIVERVVERPLRRRLSDTRMSKTHKFNVAGHEGYLTVGLYDDQTPGELFITMAKEGSTIGGLMDSLGTAISVALQYGVPVESLVYKFTHQRFEPAGMTHNPDIPFAKSLVDYIFRWMGMEFVPGYREANAPRRGGKPEPTVKAEPSRATEKSRAMSKPADAVEVAAADVKDDVIGDTAATPRRISNGNGHDNGASPSSLVAGRAPTGGVVDAATSAEAATDSTLTAAMKDMQADAPACDVCGTITVRNGTCYKCLNCGNSMGCS
jgi:ribonucleoside-diphosphate reductase alpha chain